MRKRAILLGAALLGLCLLCVIAQTIHLPQRIALPTGRFITEPVPGFIGRTNGFPATVALSPDGRYAAVLNQGYGTEQSGVRQSIAILDLTNNQIQDFPDDRLRGDDKSTQLSFFIGLAFSTDGSHIYASMGSIKQSGIAVYRFKDGKVAPERFIEIPPQQIASGKRVTYDTEEIPAGTASPYPAGLAVLNTVNGDRLLVADNLSDNVILLDIVSGRILQSFDLSTGRYIPSGYPYTVIANRSATRAWVSLWNDSAVAELNLTTGAVTRRISLSRPSGPVAPGMHPTALLLSKNEDALYVALANAAVADLDGVAAVDLKSGTLTRCYHIALGNARVAGAASMAIALSPDERYLYVGSASLNAVAVFDISPKVRWPASTGSELPVGFIPAEWYPSAVAIAGSDLLIAAAKGKGSGPNSMSAAFQTGLHPHEPHPYIPTLISGSLQRIGLGDIARNLPAYTRLVEENNLVHAPLNQFGFAHGSNPIRHVIYILKENRTYDQIFGDLPVGDGDASLTMYGAEITPNQHKLALQFGVIDDFYDSGDVSANGHLWSDASATSDYIEKIWPIIYRGSERPEDYGNGLDQGLPDMDDPGTGFIWDNLARHRITYRIYGEMMDLTWCKNERVASPREGTPSPVSSVCPSAEINKGDALPVNNGDSRERPSPWPWPVPRLKEVRPTKPAQRHHFDPLYPDFAIDYPDQLRADEFLREFDGFVKARGSARELPQFVLLYLPNDHTGGTRVGKPSPRASVADNDLAVGRVVEAVSHSAYWDDTAIFVVEDDAQDGADHVDAHRSIALVISKYSPRLGTPFVDHHFYTTNSMVHTMEALIALPPMSIFDEHAPLMTPLFSGQGNQPAYAADRRNLLNGLLYEVNNSRAPGVKESAKMDFSRPDEADAQQLNAILWKDASVHIAAAQMK